MQNLVSFSKNTAERLKELSDYPPEFWDEFLSASRWSTPNTETLVLPESKLKDLSEALGLDPEQIVLGNIDYGTFQAHVRGNVNVLPERYSVGACSHIRTSAHLFDSIERAYGWRARLRLLRRQQVTESTLRELDTKISIRFMTDLCTDIQKMGVQDAMFIRFGEQSVVRNYHSAVGEKFRSAQSIRELFEKCFTVLIGTHFDQNFSYHLSYLDGRLAIVEARPRIEVCDALQERRLGSRLVCLSKIGAFSSLPGYKHLPFAKVYESHCIHLGDECCRYHIDFTAAAEMEAASLLSEATI